MPPDKENNGDLLVELDDEQLGLFDEPKTEVVDKPKRAKRVAAPVAEEDDAVTVLRQRHEVALENERNARIAAEKRAAERDAELETARKRQAETEGDVISNAKAAAIAAAEKAQDELAKAWEDGDYKKASELNRKIARAEAVLHSLDNQEADHKERREAAPAEPAKKADPPTVSRQEAFDAFLKTIPPRAQKLFTDNPDLFHNKGNFALVNGAHAAAQARGIIFDTDEYYNFINKRLPDDEPDDEGDDDVEEDTPRRGAAAPVSREAVRTGTRRSDPRGVYLTAEEREICEAAGISQKEYAAGKLKRDREEGRNP